MIKAIEGETVRRIAAGQVITDLCSCIKELVDNALDANTPKLDIIMANWGMDWLEVADEGMGIAANCFPQLGHPHRTSKLTSMADLATLRTLGFRGEALHSLIAVSKRVIITTRTENDSHGWELTFTGLTSGGGGILRDPSIREALAGSRRGTRVRVEGLLEAYAVRRTDWQKQHKKAMARVLWTLQAYALGNPAVRIRVTHQHSAGNELLFQTSGKYDDPLSVATSLFGPAATQGMIHLQDELFDLYCSTPAVGGRSAADRQFCFCNGRPCTLPTLTKHLNGLYREHGIDRYPFLILCLRLDPDQIDVNVTPDKRTIFLQPEKLLLERLTALLTERLFPVISLTPMLAMKPAKAEDHQAREDRLSREDRVSREDRLSREDRMSEVQSTLPFPVTLPAPACCSHEPPSTSSRLIRSEEPSLPASNATLSLSLSFPPPSGKDLAPAIPLPDASLTDNPLAETPLPDTSLTETRLSDSLPPSNFLSTIAIHRDQLRDLQIIGQFNCGFIMARLPPANNQAEDLRLFIIDQHAADERYRLEKLTAELGQTMQSLLLPKRLRMAADELAIIRAEIERLGRLGFGLLDDDLEGGGGGGIRLVSAPCLGGILMDEQGI